MHSNLKTVSWLLCMGSHTHILVGVFVGSLLKHLLAICRLGEVLQASFVAINCSAGIAGYHNDVCSRDLQGEHAPMF